VAHRRREVIERHFASAMGELVMVYDNRFLREWKPMETQRNTRVLDRFGHPEG
jgi:hypothetical protein